MAVMNQWKVHELQNPHALAFLYGISRTPIDVVFECCQTTKHSRRWGWGWNFRGMALAIVVWETVCPTFVNRQTDRAITGLLPGHAPIWRNRGLRRQRGPVQQPQRGTQESGGYQYGFHEDVLQSIEQTPEQLADEQSWSDSQETNPGSRANVGKTCADSGDSDCYSFTATAHFLHARANRLAAAHPMSQDLDAGMTEDSRRDRRPWLQGCVKCGSILHGGSILPSPEERAQVRLLQVTGTHTTRQCQMLQSACLKLRLSWSRRREMRWQPATFARTFAKFEAFADEGERSRLRIEPNTWGYGFWFCSENIGIRVYRVHGGTRRPSGSLGGHRETFKRLVIGRRELKAQVDETCAQLWDRMEKRLSPPPRPTGRSGGRSSARCQLLTTRLQPLQVTPRTLRLQTRMQCRETADDMPDLESTDEEDNTAGRRRRTEANECARARRTCGRRDRGNWDTRRGARPRGL
ncbi:unnamed protein product [Sphagnum tenellum]